MSLHPQLQETLVDFTASKASISEQQFSLEVSRCLHLAFQSTILYEAGPKLSRPVLYGGKPNFRLMDLELAQPFKGQNTGGSSNAAIPLSPFWCPLTCFRFRGNGQRKRRLGDFFLSGVSEIDVFVFSRLTSASSY